MCEEGISPRSLYSLLTAARKLLRSMGLSDESIKKLKVLDFGGGLSSQAILMLVNAVPIPRLILPFRLSSGATCLWNRMN